MNSRVKIPESLQKLTKTELNHVINEAALGIENTIIARRTLIDRYAQADIAAEIGCDRSIVSRRMPKILDRLQYIAGRLCT